MFKKFLSAIILVFAFLFFNVNAVNAVENTSGLPDEVFLNAGIGEKMGYWAVVNYGEEYISSDEIVIDIDKNDGRLDILLNFYLDVSGEVILFNVTTGLIN